jgi:hypothetical protein
MPGLVSREPPRQASESCFKAKQFRPVNTKYAFPCHGRPIRQCRPCSRFKESTCFIFTNRLSNSLGTASGSQ